MLIKLLGGGGREKGGRKVGRVVHTVLQMNMKLVCSPGITCYDKI